MSDMRQMLLPVFLEEAGRKILQLEGFLSADQESRSLVDLEVAFRAAHTLKGTAALVQAEAVRSLSARIEGLLEGHFEQSRFPSDVEYEAMQLAVDRLKRLIDAVAVDLPEPAGVLAEAEMALKLATTLPGRRPLRESVEPVDVQDPFAEDPELDGLSSIASTESSGTVVVDPFADDPEIELAPTKTPFHPTSLIGAENDPFADDPDLDMGSNEEQSIPEAALSLNSVEIKDPFADDPALEYFQPEVSEVISSPDLVASAENSQDIPESPPEESSPEPRQESSFIERMRKRIEKESALQTAERLAKTLLSEDKGDAVARKYTCCHFRVAAKDYYLPISNMVEISDLPKLIHLPLAPVVVRGLINLRGQVLPVIDLSIQWGGTAKHAAVRKLVIAEADGEKLAFLSDCIPDLSEVFLGERVDVMKFVDQFRAGAS